jgi:hypothetical protein
MIVATAGFISGLTLLPKTFWPIPPDM